MLVLETVVRIRREYAGGKAIKAIARDLHVSRKVIRKAIRAPEGAFDYQRKVQPLPRIGRFGLGSIRCWKRMRCAAGASGCG